MLQRFIAVIIAALCLTSLSFNTAYALELSGTAYIIDGDTISIAGHKIRLEGIDAPEKKQTCTRATGSWSCGRESSAALASLVDGKTVHCETDEKDYFGRDLAICGIKNDDGGYVDINGWMVAEGWATAFRKYSTAYVHEEAAAKKAKKNIWSGSFQSPSDWRRDHKATHRPTGTTTKTPARVTAKRESPILCCRHCKKGIPCGDSCISASKTCHVGTGCAC